MLLMSLLCFLCVVISLDSAHGQRFSILPSPEPEVINETVGIPLHLHYTNREDNGMETWHSMNSENGLRISYYDDSAWDSVFSKFLFLVSKNTSFFNTLLNIEKTDLFRYLITFINGGIYADSDVTCLKPANEWLLEFGIENTTLSNLDFLFGVEFNKPQTHYSFIGPLPIQISQFTFGIAKGSVMMKEILFNVGRAIETIPVSKKTVLERTGPAIFTKTILETIGRFSHPTGCDEKGYPYALMSVSMLNDHGQVLHLFKDGKTFSGVMLPYRAFSFHPLHGSKKSAALTQHSFEGSWRLGKRKKGG